MSVTRALLELMKGLTGSAEIQGEIMVPRLRRIGDLEKSLDGELRQIGRSLSFNFVDKVTSVTWRSRILMA